MKALIQRVPSACVVVADATVGSINQGLLVFIGVEKNDTLIEADKMINKLLSYRVFADSQDKMNLSVSDIAGGILLISLSCESANTRYESNLLIILSASINVSFFSTPIKTNKP
jgi:D-tyrosyl-tRNA(Tyr) deacylase